MINQDDKQGSSLRLRSLSDLHHKAGEYLPIHDLEQNHTSASLDAPSTDRPFDPPTSPPSESETMKLIHELEIHHMELEMQKDELLLAKEKAESAFDEYAELYDFAPSGFMTLSVSGTIIKLNISTSQILGNVRNRLINRPFEHFVSKDTKPIFNLFLSKMLSGKTKESCEVTLLTNGNFPIHVHLTGIVHKKGEQCLVTMVDITEHIRMEDELRINEERYRLLIETVSEGIFVAQDGKIKFANPMMVELLGYPEEEIMTIPFLEFVHPVDRDRVKNNHLKRLKGEPIESVYHIRIVRKDNSIKWIRLNSARMDWEGQPATLNLIADITDHKEAELNIKLKNEELQRINAEKDKFFSIIAHDLRGPFSGFIGMTELMAKQSTELAPEQIHDVALGMNKSATNLFRLLENLLEWSKMQQGLIPFNREVVRLYPIVAGSLLIIAESARTKGIEITNNIQESLTISADINMLMTILRNLVSNALKFTPRGGKIEVSAKLSVNGIEISVKDTGIGMGPEIIESLFRPDAKTNRPGTEGEPSSGLGLILCKDFIDKHNGKIWVESEKGKGSAFHFIIPGNSNTEDPETGTANTHPRGNAGKNLKILIAEDDMTSQKYLAMIVKTLVREVLAVRTGADAVKTCRDNPDIDLVLMDIAMPVMDGYEATRQIRQFNSGVVIIAETANTLSHEREKALQAGCNDYITKPVNQYLLREIIKKHLTIL